MIKGVATVVAVAVATIVAAVAGAQSAGAATTPFAPCHGTSGVLCTTVTVPLDWSGAAPGTIPLSVEELPARGTPRGVMMMLAGGPGQASAIAFDLADLGSTWQSLFPGYTLVAFDPRGTGNSGFLGCSIDSSDPIVSDAEVAACGDALGPARVFYTTAANAEDVQAVRQAVGVDKIAMWGTSYGTKVELAYGLAHPDHVERMLLDSVVTPTGPDPFSLDMLQNMPLGLQSLCGTAACRKISPNLAAEVVGLANKAALTPIRGRVHTAVGQLETVSLDGPTLLSIVVTADLSPGLEAELPTAVEAAAAGRPQALLRIAAFAEGGFHLDSLRTVADTSFSEGLFFATMCNDGRFPWQPNADAATRRQAVTAAVAALPAGSTGPFGSWAASIGPATYCLPWPSPSGNAPLAAGPLPDVPVLALSGSLDMRTPTANAASVVAQFPQGHLLVVPGVGHSVLTVDPSGCARTAVKTWLNGGTPPTRCAPARPYVSAVPRIPVSVATSPFAGGVKGLRGRTLSAAETTVQDALAAAVTAGGSIGGLAGGHASPGGGDLTLSRYSDVPGLTVSGSLTLKLSLDGKGPVYSLNGTVAVAGPKAARGTLTYSAGRVSVRWAASR